jgi:hypothetical protein
MQPNSGVESAARKQSVHLLRSQIRTPALPVDVDAMEPNLKKILSVDETDYQTVLLTCSR